MVFVTVPLRTLPAVKHGYSMSTKEPFCMVGRDKREIEVTRNMETHFRKYWREYNGKSEHLGGCNVIGVRNRRVRQ